MYSTQGYQIPSKIKYESLKPEYDNISKEHINFLSHNITTAKFNKVDGNGARRTAGNSEDTMNKSSRAGGSRNA